MSCQFLRGSIGAPPVLRILARYASLAVRKSVFQGKTISATEAYVVSQQTFPGIAQARFRREVCDVLLAPVVEKDVEITVDGRIYLPEDKIRCILNRAFGEGGWNILPRSPGSLLGGPEGHLMVREYALFAGGRFVSQAFGQVEVDEGSTVTPFESTRSTALRRCCKDLGIASELWDPSWTTRWKAKNAVMLQVENEITKGKRWLWRRKDGQFSHPWRELKP